MQAPCSTANLAALAAAASLILSLSSCKKDDPSNPNSSPACLPIEEREVGTGDRLHSYEYDSQGRIVSFTNPLFYGNGQLSEVPHAVSYEGEDIVINKGSAPGSGIPSVTRLVRQGGRLVYRLYGGTSSELIDTTFYRYLGDRLTGIERHVRYTMDEPGLFEGARTVDSILYQGGLPSVIITKKWDAAGVFTDSTARHLEYDTREVSYSPYSLFLLAPGLELVKVNRMLKQVKYFYKDPVLGTSGSGIEATYQTVYDQMANPEQVSVSDTPFGSVTRITYQCK